MTTSTSHQVISTLSVSVELQVHVPAVEGQSEVTPSPVVFPFLPAFYVHNTEISVTTVSPLTTVRVSTIPDLASCIQVCRALSGIVHGSIGNCGILLKNGKFYSINCIRNLFMPPAWKVCRGHLVIGSSVCLSVRNSVPLTKSNN